MAAANSAQPGRRGLGRRRGPPEALVQQRVAQPELLDRRDRQTAPEIEVLEHHSRLAGHLGAQRHHRRDRARVDVRHLHAGPEVDVDPGQRDAGDRRQAAVRLESLARVDLDTELCLPAGAGRDAHRDPHRPGGRVHHPGQARDLLEGVDVNACQSVGHGEAQPRDGLVDAVQQDPVASQPEAQREPGLVFGDRLGADALFVEHPQHAGDAVRLVGVEHVHVPEGAAEHPAELARRAPQGVLVDDVEGSSVAARELDDVAASDRQPVALVAGEPPGLRGGPRGAGHGRAPGAGTGRGRVSSMK